MALFINKIPVQLGTIENKSRMTEGSIKDKIDLKPPLGKCSFGKPYAREF